MHFLVVLHFLIYPNLTDVVAGDLFYLHIQYLPFIPPVFMLISANFT